MCTAISPCLAQTTINAVYFAQTHVQKATDPYPTLVGNRDALIKAHVVNPATPASPVVSATLTLNGNTLNLPLTGPATLPASIPDGSGVIQHSKTNTFTAIMPAAWVKPGLTVQVNAGAVSSAVQTPDIGAPNTVIMTMTDVHFFSLAPGDYPAGWDTELKAKWPVADLQIRRANDVVFSELVIPPRAGAPAARIVSKQDYVNQTGIAFDGENSAATAWNVGLRRAAGRTVGYSLYYLNKYNCANEGVAGGFSGVGTGNAGSVGILHHELGHALSLPHWGDSASYPYKGAMFGINPPDIYNETHAGPVWAFHLPTQAFIPCTVQPGNVGAKPTGTYKADPMEGGGIGFQEAGYILNHFSDYSASQMRSYMQNTIVVWNAAQNSYAKWNAAAKDYTTLLSNDGVKYPLLRDQNVISVIAAVSGPTPGACMVYPPIGPYTAGMIRLFDPSNASDRAAAQTSFAPAGGCDVSLRITQGGVVKTYMLAASYDPAGNPTDAATLFTEGVNLAASDGAVTQVDLLLTPNAQISGLPGSPQVLYSWASPAAPAQGSFSVAPSALDNASITMTATTGTYVADSNGRIEYYFDEVSGNPGGSDSGWQSSPTYMDTGLQANTQYRYTVAMRSAASGTVGTASAESSATTFNRTGTFTICTANHAATNVWTDDTWSDGTPAGNVDVQIAAGVQLRNWANVPAWSGTLLLDTGSSIDIDEIGGAFLQAPNATKGATSITMRNAAIYDNYESDQTFPAINIEGASKFQCNDGSNNVVSKKRIFSGIISGYGGFSITGRRFMSYIFNATNPYIGGLTAKSPSRYVIELNAAGSAGNGNVTVESSDGTSTGLSAVMKLGANNPFHRNATVTITGAGWGGLANGAYPNSTTLIDMQSFSATIANLTVNGVSIPPGSYTGTSGYAWLRGTGTLTVTGPQTVSTWASSFAGMGGLNGFNQDADGDGLANAVENYLGTDPSKNSTGLNIASKVANIVTLSHPLNPLPATDVNATYIWSDNLNNFYASGASNGSGTTVGIVRNANNGTATTATATVSGPVPARLFFRIKVTQGP